MIIHATSDLHGYQPELPGGDLLIIAGDCTGRNTMQDWSAFFNWLETLQYHEIVIVPGNHDGMLAKLPQELSDVLVDEVIEINEIKIYGSPWTPKFQNQNPHAMSYAIPRNKLEYKWKPYLEQEDVDILVTHGPPLGILDRAPEVYNAMRLGDAHLLDAVRACNPRYHIFGHIHEGYGRLERDGTTFLNVAAVDEKYNLRETAHVEIIL